MEALNDSIRLNEVAETTLAYRLKYPAIESLAVEVRAKLVRMLESL